MPAVLVLNHLTDHQLHQVCSDNINQDHLHQSDIDCDFDDLNFLPLFYTKTIQLTTVFVAVHDAVNTKTYNYIYQDKKHTFLLRAPPTA